MKLAVLASKAARLPEIDFEWPGPEQYDVYKGKVQIGYLRLRHGRFRADYPECGGETVFEGQPKGDGEFEDGEREKYLSAAVDALLEAHRRSY